MALELPERERRELAAWRDELIVGRDDLRPVKEEALHVTLAFLGYRPEKEIAAIADLLPSGQAPLLAPRGMVALPPRRPRLFALELEDPSGRAAELQQELSDALEAARFYKPEKRRFWPHVTLARVKRDRRAELPARRSPLQPFASTRVTLYRSLLRPQGALYEPLAQSELSP